LCRHLKELETLINSNSMSRFQKKKSITHDSGEDDESMYGEMESKRTRKIASPQRQGTMVDEAVEEIMKNEQDELQARS
jgi:hypothetical protein